MIICNCYFVFFLVFSFIFWWISCTFIVNCLSSSIVVLTFCTWYADDFIFSDRSSSKMHQHFTRLCSFWSQTEHSETVFFEALDFKDWISVFLCFCLFFDEVYSVSWLFLTSESSLKDSVNSMFVWKTFFWKVHSFLKVLFSLSQSFLITFQNFSESDFASLSAFFINYTKKVSDVDLTRFVRSLNQWLFTISDKLYLIYSIMMISYSFNHWESLFDLKLFKILW